MAKKKAKAKPEPASRLGTLKQCAAGLHLGDRRVQQLAREGLPKASRGRYNVEACRSWYIRYLQKKLAEKALPDPDGGLTATTEVRHRLLSMEAEIRQLDLAEKRGVLISIEKVGKDLAGLVLEIKTRLLAVPPRLAGEVIGEKEIVVIQDKIERALHEALIQLSQFNVETLRASGPVPARR